MNSVAIFQFGVYWHKYLLVVVFYSVSLKQIALAFSQLKLEVKWNIKRFWTQPRSHEQNKIIILNIHAVTKKQKLTQKWPQRFLEANRFYDNTAIVLSDTCAQHSTALKGQYPSLYGYLFLSFSLRTSEANYLRESFSFYSAIRDRAYYSQASKEEKYIIALDSFDIFYSTNWIK